MKLLLSSKLIRIGKCTTSKPVAFKIADSMKEVFNLKFSELKILDWFLYLMNMQNEIAGNGDVCWEKTSMLVTFSNFK